jgi:hypothetical protein
MDYVVKQGDCIFSIAGDNGFFWESIWNDPQNASLKALRKEPNVLLPGDVVYLRDKEIKQEPRPTEARHKFVKKGIPGMLRLQMLDRNHQPRTGLSYILVIDGVSHAGTTDGNGWINEPMPPNAKKADLTLNDGDETENFSIGLGDVDPITVDTGVQQRLKNLGFNATGTDWSSAITGFQNKFGLPASGAADDSTRAKLKEIHGC